MMVNFTLQVILKIKRCLNKLMEGFFLLYLLNFFRDLPPQLMPQGKQGPVEAKVIDKHTEKYKPPPVDPFSLPGHRLGSATSSISQPLSIPQVVNTQPTKTISSLQGFFFTYYLNNI
jgi:hypothetical protein